MNRQSARILCGGAVWVLCGLLGLSCAGGTGADAAGAPDQAAGDIAAPDTPGDLPRVDQSPPPDAPAGDTPAEASPPLDGAPGDADAAAPDPPLVVAPAGPMRGVAGTGYRAFLGIPYAAPPVGPLRFAPPEPAAPWSAVRDTTAPGPLCPQPPNPFGVAAPAVSEDCLTLNVYAPDPAPTAAPVMVWIHGGGFVWGAGSEPTYDGRVLASQGVVVVTFNYRLGALGFLAHPALAAENPDRPSSGNYGLLDQQRALAWVQENIAAFGGDPQNVTIFGESAGGASVCLHLVISRGRGLFGRAILQSGICSPATPRAAGEAQGLQLAAALGCDTAADVAGCLRAAPADAVATALPVPPALLFGQGTRFGPVEDGLIIAGNPIVQLFTGQFEKVPVIIGANGDEGRLFILMAGGGLSEADYRAMWDGLMPGKADQILAEYPVPPGGSVDDVAAEALGDGLFVCMAKLGAQVLAGASVPTYVYHFTRPVETAVFPDFGATHTAELKFVFGTEYLGVGLGPADLPLAAAMQGYWTRFARQGDPNSPLGTGVAWPVYSNANGEKAYLRLDSDIAVERDLEAERCAFWSQLYLSL